MKRLVCVLICLCFLVVCGCASSETPSSSEEGTAVTHSDPVAESEMFTDRDLEADYDEKACIPVTLGEPSSDKSVVVQGTTVTLTGEGPYLVRGSLTGMLKVDAEGCKPRLIFDNVSILSESFAPLYILEADKVVITLVGQNALTGGASFTAIDENNVDGALFSKQDLTFNGTGSLSVSSPGGHGIVCKDDLVLAGGDFTVVSASHGLDANDSVRIQGATLTLETGKDGIHAENTEDSGKGFIYVASGKINVDAQGDGISASSTLQIKDGEFDILAGGGSENAAKATSDNWGDFGGRYPEMGPGNRREGTQVTPTATEETTEDSSTSIKGIKAAGDMTIFGGRFTLNAADDALHSNTSITVSGGNFQIQSGDDGIHADEALTVTDGEINISASYEGLEALDIVFSGGNAQIVATDDGLNAAGGTDQSGFGGMRGDDNFGRQPMPGESGVYQGARSNGAEPPLLQTAMGGGRGNMGGMSAGNGSILISGGTLYVQASGDGIDANGSVEITGGHTIVCGPTRGDTATLDYDTEAVISGGTFIGTGAQGMAQTFSDAKQGLISVTVGQQTAGNKIVLQDQQGKVLLEHTPALDYAIVILSSPEVQKGTTYSLTVGTDSAEITAE